VAPGYAQSGDGVSTCVTRSGAPTKTKSCISCVSRAHQHSRSLRRDEPSLTAGHVLQVRCQRSNGEKVEVTNVHLEATRMFFGGRRFGSGVLVAMGAAASSTGLGGLHADAATSCAISRRGKRKRIGQQGKCSRSCGA
jgi:hypothetical protein